MLSPLLPAALAAGATAATLARAHLRERAAEAAFPPEGRLVDVGGVPVHVVTRGTGPDLVVIHGASGNARDWTFAFVDRMADRYTVHAVDRPGMGHTGRVNPDYDRPLSSAAETPREQAELLQGAMAALGVERPIVCGHSFGGTIALAWACYRPGTLSGLVLVGAASNRWEGGLGPLYAVNASAFGGAAIVPMFAAYASDAKVAAVTRAIFDPDPVPEGYLAHVGAQLTLRRRSLRANARQVNGLKPHVIAMEALYPSLDLPIEWVHGAADTICPAHIHPEPFTAMVPHAHLTMLPGVGHMPHHVAPDAVDDAVGRVRDAR